MPRVSKDSCALVARMLLRKVRVMRKVPESFQSKRVAVVGELMTPKKLRIFVSEGRLFLSADAGRHRKEVTMDSLPAISLTPHSKLGEKVCSDFVNL